LLRRFLFLLLPPLSLAVLAASLPWVHGAVAGDHSAPSPSTHVFLTPAQRQALSSTPTLAEAAALEASVRADVGGLQRTARELTARREAEAAAAALPPPPSPEEIGAAELATTTVPPGIAFGPDERWIAVDLTTQRAVAFVGAQPVRVALVTTGMDGWETPVGDFHIYSRVENETMTSDFLGIPRDAADGYYLEDVYFTQYFISSVALHYNYWRPDSYFGNVRSSHGCVGMRYADAEFFWNFANIGTRVVVYT
jgi:lipoprotein-anchoring transpeptidase ErfK/SrfK